MTTPAPVSTPKSVSRAQIRVLLLGLGNDILSDDAVGLHLARKLRQRLSECNGIEVQETCEMGLSLLDRIVGFDELVLLDAVQTGQAPPGFLHEFRSEQLAALPTRSPHALGISEVLALGQQLGLDVPRRVRIFAVEVEDPFTIGTEMTPALRRALPRLVQQVIEAFPGTVDSHLDAGRLAKEGLLC